MKSKWDPPTYSEAVSDNRGRVDSKHFDTTDTVEHPTATNHTVKAENTLQNAGYVNSAFNSNYETFPKSTSSSSNHGNDASYRNGGIGEKTFSESSLMSTSTQGGGINSPLTESVCLNMLGDSCDASTLSRNTTLDSNDLDASVVTCIAIDNRSSSVLSDDNIGDVGSIASDDVFSKGEVGEISVHVIVNESDNWNKNVNNNNKHNINSEGDVYLEKVPEDKLDTKDNKDINCGSSNSVENEKQFSNSSEKYVEKSNTKQQKLFLTVPVVENNHQTANNLGNKDSYNSPQLHELSVVTLDNVIQEDIQKKDLNRINPVEFRRKLSYFHYREDSDRPPRAKDHILLSCLVLACCNPVFGIFAFIFSLAVNRQYESGHYDKSLLFSRLSFYVSILGILVTVTLTITLLIVYWPETATHTDTQAYQGHTSAI